MPKRIIIPPIKSQGIKTKLVPWIGSIVPKDTKRWIEPFFGTGVVGFNLAVQNAIFSDTNPHVIKFYSDIKEGRITPESVRQFLEVEGERLRSSAEDGYEHYKFIKHRFNDTYGSLDFLFLSRAGFNGMMRFNKKGEWNLPFCKKPNRFSKAYITKIVNQVADVSKVMEKKEWIFLHSNFKNTIAFAKKGDIIYCDPPYSGRYVDYYNGWDDEDEEELYNSLKNTKAKFILSTWHHNDYRSNLMIDKYWSEFNIITRDHFYHSGAKIENRQSIVEALVFNYEVNIKKHNSDQSEKPEQFALGY